MKRTVVIFISMAMLSASIEAYSGENGNCHVSACNHSYMRRIIGDVFICSGPLSVLSGDFMDCGHPAYLRTACSGSAYTYDTVACSVAGTTFYGVYHPTNCQVFRTYNYTVTYCTYPGCNVRYNSGYHLCKYAHTQCSVSGSVCNQ